MDMDMVVNSGNLFCLRSGGKSKSIALVSLSDDGEVTFRGEISDIQRLKPNQEFYIISKVGGVILIHATILKINWKQVYDVSVYDPDEQSVITMTVDAICLIKQCQYFEEIE